VLFARALIAHGKSPERIRRVTCIIMHRRRREFVEPLIVGLPGSAARTAARHVTAATALSTSSLPHGTHTIAAVYLVDATNRASTTSITLVVN
jgi:hypothetical protein